MSIAKIRLAGDVGEVKNQFNRGLALVDTDTVGVSDHAVLEIHAISQLATTAQHVDRHNELRQLVQNDEVPPVIIRPSGLLQRRFDAIGLNICELLRESTGREPVSVEDGYILWYLQPGDSLAEHRDDSSGYGMRIGMPLGGLALFQASNHKQGILGSPSMIVQNLQSPIAHGATNITPGRKVAIWDIETKSG